jgi:hypothetical protein
MGCKTNNKPLHGPQTKSYIYNKLHIQTFLVLSQASMQKLKDYLANRASNTMHLRC